MYNVSAGRHEVWMILAAAAMAGALSVRAATTGGLTNHVWYAGGRIYSSPAIGADGTVYVGSTNGCLYAFNPNGTTQHVWNLGDKIFASPSVSTGGTIYVGCDNNNFYALNPDGSTQHVWACGDRLVGIASIARDGTIYAGCADGCLYAFNPDGTTQRTWYLKQMESAFVSSPAISSNGLICFGGYASNVYLFNPDGTTQMIWSITGTGGFDASPAFGSNGNIYIGDSDGYLYDLNPNDGSISHTWGPAPGLFYGSPVIGADGTIYQGDTKSNFFAFNPDGTTQRVWNTTKGIYGSPAIAADGTIYVGCNDGGLYGFNPDGTTNVFWQLDSYGYRIQASPAIGLDGSVYIGQYDGTKFFSLQGTGGRLADTPWPKFGQNMENSCRRLAPPAGLEANAIPGTNKVALAWSNEPYASGYVVFKNTSGNPNTAVPVGRTAGTTYIDNGVVPVLTNYYWVRSTNTTAVSVMGTPTTVRRSMLPMTGLAASQGDYTDKITVVWSRNPDAVQYAVFVSTNNVPASAILICVTNGLTCTDTTAEPGIRNYYWVRGKAFGALTPFGTSAMGWRGITELEASDGTHADRIALSWTAVGGAHGYTVLRGLSNHLEGVTELAGTAATTYDDTSCEAGTYYYYWVMATNSSGMASLSAGDRGWRATGNPPDAPEGLSATKGEYADKVALAWNKADEANGYTVYRGLTSSTGGAAAVGSTEGTAFDDTNAVADTTYYYWLKATNTYGASNFSAADTGWRAAGLPPSPPAEVTASEGTHHDKVAVSWSASDNASGYTVWRASGCNTNDAELLGASALTAYDDTNAVAEATYYYWVRATNAYGSSAFGSGAWGWRLIQDPPLPPASVAATDGTYSDRVRVTWNSASGATSYSVWRAQTNESAQATRICGGLSDCLYDDPNPATGTRFWYWVKAENEGGESDFSAPEQGYAKSPVASSLGVNDYNGDRRADLAIFDNASGSWFILETDGTLLLWAEPWGWPGAIPVPGDYDGDRIFDLAVFDNNTGNWYVKGLSGAVIAWAKPWGWPGADPVYGDYDGDGRSDLAVFDENTGHWYAYSLENGLLLWAQPWGWPGAVTVPGDFDADGLSDLAVFDNNTGCWYILRTDGALLVWARPWGWPGATVVGGRR